MSVFKEKIENFCWTCGEEAIAVKVAKTKASKESGMMWRCKNDHMDRTRKYILKQVKLG